MNVRRATFAAFITATLAVTWTAAQNTEQKKDQPNNRTSDPAQTAQKFIKEHDKNGDGSLTREELPAGLRESYADMDANKDGKLSSEELQSQSARLVFVPVPIEIVSYYVVEAAQSPPTRQDLQNVYSLLRKTDSNNDGQLSEDEIEAARDNAIQQRAEAVFKRCDKNNDGKISTDECPGDIQGLLNRADKDNDNQVTREEFMACCRSDAEQSKKNKGGNKPTDSDKR